MMTQDDVSESDIWPAFLQVYNYGKTIGAKFGKKQEQEPEPEKPKIKEGEIRLRGKDGKITIAKRYTDETHIITEFPDGFKLWELK